MGEKVGGWSNRKKTFTVGGTLGALASLVTIVTFVTGHNPPVPAPTWSPPPNTATYSPGPTAPAPVAATSSDYPASAQSAVVSDCQQNYYEPASICQCDLNWLEANVPYTMYESDPTGWVGRADSYASCQ